MDGNQMGFPDGTRNQGLFNLGIYVRKRYGEDDLAHHLDDMNQKFMDRIPSLLLIQQIHKVIPLVIVILLR